MTTTRKLAPLAALVALSLLTSGCGTDADGGGAADGGSSPTPAAGDEAPAEPSPEPTAEPEVDEPEDEPTPDRPTAPPKKSVAAGTVGGGSAATAEGKGDAEVTFVRDGEFAVVIELDCARCDGTTVLTGPGRGTPFGEADGALTGEYLMDVFEGSDAEQSVWIAADGPWTLRFSSWNDLTPQAGPWSGTGSTVIFLGGEAAQAEVSWMPADADDSFQGRYFGTDEAAARMFGDTEEFTDVVELAQPGVLAITTDGEWTVTPG
ncbi:hypothetical protein [Isoptericola croceus]|uniref:hypothetical protein n=1 Tax=Isoptericola croceus TaxID=3031406 RepID=UPI0023F7DD97|nr:hypothetical protein [Isoptericola croceus]